ncbi:MAG: hypothetical protein IJM18_06330, partial [Clostridia bacterium]|nr:hypothetical protein [Clostridia bacterium]
DYVEYGKVVHVVPPKYLFISTWDYTADPLLLQYRAVKNSGKTICPLQDIYNNGIITGTKKR